MKYLKYGLLIAGVAGIILFIQSLFFNDEVWNAWSLPLSGKIIVLDPGHGGPDAGANNGDVLEKEIALNVSLKLRDFLQEQGALVLMTREGDYDLSNGAPKGKIKSTDLRNRVEMINGADADMYLSIHLNSIPSDKWRGAQIFYNPNRPENEQLAKLIQDEIKKNLENTERQAKPMQNVYIVRKAAVPGALCEIGFLSHPQERALLNTEEYQEKIAACMYNGIMRYFSGETLVQ